MSKATDLREQAIAKFKEADALIAGDDGPKAEDQERFDALFADGQALMKDYTAAAATEGKIVAVREALSDIAGAVRGTGPVPFTARTVVPTAGKSMGQAFIESEAYADLVASGALKSDRQAFRTKQVDIKAATDVISTVSGEPAAALVTPQYLPGVLPLGQQPLTIRGLFGAGTASSDVISYAQQSSLEGSAQAVAQATAVDGSGAAGGVKPQASAAWERKTAAVEAIAVWMATTRAAMADAGQVRALIDNNLRYLLALEEEDQLLNGNGTSPNLSGVYDQTIQTLDLTGLDNLDGIRTARRLVMTGTSRLRADAIVLHPADAEEFDLLKDDDGSYRGGNPIGNFAFDQPIWGLRRVESESVAEGSALVGAFRAGATVFERQGVTIMAADQHADFFIRNLMVILAEERLGFAVFYPTAFVDVTLAAWGS